MKEENKKIKLEETKKNIIWGLQDPGSNRYLISKFWFLRAIFFSFLFWLILFSLKSLSLLSFWNIVFGKSWASEIGVREMLAPRFSSIFGGGGSYAKALRSEVLPTLKLQTDKQVYRPGDPVIVTIEISNPAGNADLPLSLLVERLSFEIKGVEKLDTQWFATQKPIPGSKQRRGSSGLLFKILLGGRNCWRICVEF